MAEIQLRKPATATIGGVRVGSNAPVMVQSMTNTDTADIPGTIKQVAALARAGSEVVRVIVIVDGDADDFAAGTRQGGDLLYGARDVRGVGVGHRLHHDRCIAAYSDAADGGGNGFSTLNFCHIRSYILAGYSQKIAPVERTAGTERRSYGILVSPGNVFTRSL